MSIETPSIEKAPNIEELKRILSQAYEKDAMGVWNKTAEFVAKLEQAHPNCRGHRLFHLIARSTLMPEEEAKMKEGDFEGEYSIEAFIKSL
jgi:hypothetical protein